MQNTPAELGHPSNGPLDSIFRRIRTLIRAYRTSQRVLRDFSRYGIERKRFHRAIFLTGIARVLSMAQIFFIYKLVAALVADQAHPIFEGRLGQILGWIIPNDSAEPITACAALVIVSIALKAVEIACNYRVEKFLYQSSRSVHSAINLDIFSKALRFSFSFFDRAWLGKNLHPSDLSRILIQRTHAHAEQVRHAYDFMTGFWSLCLFLGVCAALSFKFFVLSVLVVGFSRVVSTLALRKIARAASQARVQSQQSNRAVSSVIGALVHVKCANMEDREIERFTVLNEEFLDEADEAKKLQLLEAPVTEASKTLSSVTFALCIIFIKSITTASKVPLATAGLVLIRKIEQAIHKMQTAAQQLAKYEQQREEISVIQATQLETEKIREGDSVAKFERLIELKDLTFAYPNGKPALNHVGLSLHRGEMLGIVGPSGSGKSTLLKIMLRLYNIDRGHYLIDGQDVNDLTLASVRNLYSVVTQESVWLAGTVRENLVYGLGHEVSDSELTEICKRVNAWRPIQKHANGLSMQMSSRGGAFSAGELQCLALARALLRDSKILFFDEYTSALDAATELMVQEALAELGRDRTLIVIAHRLSTLARANRVAVLNQGILEEVDTVERLLEKQGKFHELWHKQGSFWLGDRAA